MLFRSAEEAEAKYKTGEAVFFFRYFAVECSDAEMILEESSTWGIKHTRTHTFAEVLDGVHGECISVHGRDPPPSLHSSVRVFLSNHGRFYAQDVKANLYPDYIPTYGCFRK